MVQTYRTIQDMITGVYGGQVQGVSKFLSEAPVLTTTTGVLNTVFGAAAFNQLNMEANAFALMPKYPWPQGGFRVITANAGSDGDGGAVENATIASSIQPTWAEITVTPGEVQHVFEVSMRQQGLVTKGADDAVGDIDFNRRYFATKHAKAINQQLLRDTDTLLSVNNGFESIDRVTADTAGATAGLYTAGDEDIYGIDRSANSWADAHVSHNSGTDRTLSADIIEDALATVREQGGRTNVMLTGWDTVSRIAGLYNNQVRYSGVMSDENISVGLNGVSTDTGGNFGSRVATVYGIPLFGSADVVKDTISRIYLLDTTEQEGTGVPRLGIAMLWPTLYLEGGMAAGGGDVFGVGSLSTKGMYYTAGQLVCTFFAAQGSIRDLQ